MATGVVIRIVVLFVTMLFFMFLKFPVFLSLASASVMYLVFFPGSVPPAVFVQSLAQGVGKETFVAVMFYFLMGEIMNSGGISERLLDLLNAAIGWMRGSMSHINILASVIFAGVSGSANADTAAIGSMMIPVMKKQGYPAGYAAAVTECSSVIGPIIPPSSGLVILATYMNCSVRKLLCAGIIPGLMMGLVELTVSFLISHRRGFPRVEWAGWKTLWEKFKVGCWAIVLPVATILCLVFGIGTVTEVGAMSCVFAFLIAKFAYNELSFKKFCSTFMNSTVLAGRVLCSIGTAGVFVWIISSMGAATKLAKLVADSGLSQTGVMFAIVVILFFAGMFLNVSVMIQVLIPVMIPTVLGMGINPFYFGIIALLIAQLGVNTPPVGSLIYITSSIAECPSTETIKESIPYLVALVLMIIVWILCPSIITWFPSRI